MVFVLYVLVTNMPFYVSNYQQTRPPIFAWTRW